MTHNSANVNAAWKTNCLIWGMGWSITSTLTHGMPDVPP